MPLEHTYKAFDIDIDTLRSSVTTMGGLVERQFVRAVDAVRYGDLRRVMEVLTDEQTVNRMHIETDLRCNQEIAKRQPIAVDLRETIAVIHSISDLERIGDEAKKIALKAQAFNGRELPINIDKIQRMADLVAEMLSAAIDAFVRHDTAVAGHDKAASTELLFPTVSLIDKAVNKGILHRNTAARHKSRLTKHVNSLA